MAVILNMASTCCITPALLAINSTSPALMETLGAYVELMYDKGPSPRCLNCTCPHQLILCVAAERLHALRWSCRIGTIKSTGILNALS